MPDIKPEENKTSSIDYSLIPNGTVTVIIKNKDKVFTTGLTLPSLDKETAEEDVVMALQRVKDSQDRLMNTVYYTLAERDKSKELPELA
jgi:hypothetical protein